MGLMLDIAVGMCAVFLLASLFVTVLQELIAQLLALRARYLAVGIINLFQAGQESIGPMAAIAKVAPKAGSAGPASTPPTASGFYAHRMIAALSSNRVWQTEKPSYISKETFATVALDLTNVIRSPIASAPALTPTDVLNAARAINPATPLEAAVRTFAEEVGGNIDKLKELLGEWFDDAMERVSGAYKRWTQIAALLLGLIVAVAVNIDTIAIVTFLANSPQQAKKFADGVENVIKQHPELKPEDRVAIQEGLRAAVTAASLPIGWNNSSKAAEQNVLLKIIGWLLTALAASLGAAFWFDTLKRFVSIRSSGKNPKET